MPGTNDSWVAISYEKDSQTHTAYFAAFTQQGEKVIPQPPHGLLEMFGKNTVS